jgi:hypothetical protein
MKNIDSRILEQALTLLERRLSRGKNPPLELVVCGGSALIATGLVTRTTKDVDVLALMDSASNLIDPSPLPSYLISAAKIVAQNLNLPEDWLNTGPADLFRMGLPEGFEDRLICHEIGPSLKVHFISRLDQIHFKLYASVDRGGYHIEDLLALNPSQNELIKAGQWSRTHDVSDGYAMLLSDLLNQLGYKYAASRV